MHGVEHQWNPWQFPPQRIVAHCSCPFKVMLLVVNVRQYEHQRGTSHRPVSVALAVEVQRTPIAMPFDTIVPF
jgi:hypothetical protein